MLPSSVTADIPDTVWVHRSDCFDTDNVRKMGSNEIPWGFRAAAIIGDMTEQQAHPSWFACSTSHCGLGAELVANAFPVTVFPCVIWTEFVCSPCFFFFLLLFTSLGYWKQLCVNKTMWWGDFAGGEAQMSPNTLLCSTAGHCVTATVRRCRSGGEMDG